MRLNRPLFALAAALLAPAAASAENAEVGKLTCRQTDNTNLVIFSEATFGCTFEPTDGPTEHYTGKASKVGLDLSTSKVETMIWYVFAPSAGKAGSLAGTYVGASADVALGAGVGARVLVGGLDNSFTLQPASVSGVEGVGIAAGLEQFDLTYKLSN